MLDICSLRHKFIIVTIGPALLLFFIAAGSAAQHLHNGGASGVPFLQYETPPLESRTGLSDDEAIQLATEAVGKSDGRPEMIMGKDYSEIQIIRNPNIVRVSFIEPLPPGTLGSDVLVTVLLDAQTGDCIQIIGY